MEMRKCKQCGKGFPFRPTRRNKVFCCVECRQKWAAAHPEHFKHEKYYKKTCLHCGKKFLSLQTKNKYCSHDCDVKERFAIR